MQADHSGTKKKKWEKKVRGRNVWMYNGTKRNLIRLWRGGGGGAKEKVKGTPLAKEEFKSPSKNQKGERDDLGGKKNYGLWVRRVAEYDVRKRFGSTRRSRPAERRKNIVSHTNRAFDGRRGEGL